MMKMLVQSGLIIGGVALSLAVIEKMEKLSLKRNVKTIKVNSKKDEVKLTEEQIKEAFESAIKKADEMGL